MSADPIIHAQGLSKCYALFQRPVDRLLQMLSFGRKRYYREFWSLRDVSLSIGRGEVVGIVGRNGAGKSTLLQLICGTLQPTSGEIAVQGRVAALLELGAGFNPDFSGRENVYLSAAILGLSSEEIAARFDEIVAFSELAAFIDQPVSTYSSGMYVRLAFAVATSVEPDILVIDEALSVGDGAFARKSFDRIMALKEAGTTILFCSHAMYHIEALCSRALWLERGQVRMLDVASRVTAAYQADLDGFGRSTLTAEVPATSMPSPASAADAVATDATTDVPLPTGTARLLRVTASTSAGHSGEQLCLQSGQDDLRLKFDFVCDPALPCPSVGVGFALDNGTTIASASSINDGHLLHFDPQQAGHGSVYLEFPRLPLLKGRYTLTVFLACERGVHVYEVRERCLTLTVEQRGLEQGLVALPHRWA